jgi:CheY-like chemotaxis protein
VKTILVVDDELGSAEVLALILGEEGYRTASAVNGRLALDLAHDLAPDLVIADYMMPEMNGADLARALRADARFSGLKIIMNSGLPEAALRERFDGYDAFLRKPFNVDVLLSLVRQLLPD